jgi:hypothetical protein
VETDVRWHHGQTLAAGQVAEFKVWAELVRQSRGGLHVFLPLRDMGIDGVVHRVADGAYLAIQVKGRTELTPAGQVHITVTSTSLRDDDALVLGVLVDGEQLGRMALVVPESKFRELAAHDVVNGREYLTAAFELHEGGRSRWAPFLVASERLAERFGCSAELLPEAAVGDVSLLDRGREGFLGESEVIRRLAEAESLNLFRPFPDLETVEVLARHVTTRRFLGMQVKTAGWDREHVENRVYFRRSSFRAAPSTHVCVLSWNRDEGRFEDRCLLIPSGDIAGIARIDGEWLVVELQPGSVHHRRLEVYRTPLALLGPAVEAMLESGT